MNWGYGIALTVIGFVLFMGFLVVKSVQQDFYLVSENYYEKGVEYDEMQQKLNNTQALPVTPEVTMAGHNVQLNLPTEVASGNIVFYRPDNSNLDFELILEAGKKEYLVDASDLRSGNWKVQMDWTDGSKAYYSEKGIFIP